MATGFTPGNRLWELRTSIGRERLFAEPSLLLEAAEAYYNACHDNPMIVRETTTEETTVNGVTAEGAPAGTFPVQTISKTKVREVPIAMTWKGFCVYLGVVESYFRKFRFDLAKEINNPATSAERLELAKAYVTVIEEIEMIIYSQKFQGAAGGLFNANIIARDLGLVEKVESKNINENFNRDATSMTREEIKEIQKALNEEV